EVDNPPGNNCPPSVTGRSLRIVENRRVLYGSRTLGVVVGNLTVPPTDLHSVDQRWLRSSRFGIVTEFLHCALSPLEREVARSNFPYVASIAADPSAKACHHSAACTGGTGL